MRKNTMTLVLDQNYQMVKEIPWTDALIKVFNNKAEIVLSYADDIIWHSAHRTVELGGKMINKLFRPKAIRLRKFIVGTVVNKCKIKRLSDYALLERDDYSCQYCAREVTRKNFTKDHVIPRSRGGRTIARNLVVACDRCNQRKGDRTPEEAGMVLLKPVRDITHFDATRFMRSVYD